MKNLIIKERMLKLRSAMKSAGIDFYMIPTADFHNSEYVSDYFKVREYFCNFSGSNGTLLVWQEGAGLWTDGRYFIQAEKELLGTGVELFRMMEEGVPTISEFLKEQMKEGQTLGFDGRVISAAEGLRLEEKLKAKQIRLVYDKDPAEGIWSDRPAFPAGELRILPDSITGKSAKEKLSEVREKLKEQEAEGLLLTKLDDLMWLFNIRGCDVECNPVAMSYGYITEEQAVLFLQERIVTEEVRNYLAEQGVIVSEYWGIVDFLKGLSGSDGGKIIADNRHCNYLLYKTLTERQTVINKKNPTEILKAVKNPTELANMRDIYLKDSVAVTKFIYWLKTHVGKNAADTEGNGCEAGYREDGVITEVTAADKLEEFRRQIPEFLDLSFPTIAGYKGNAAMMHYEATPENCAVLKPEGMLLVDSGGQYLGGTTDVTRTIVLGPLTEAEKKHYTLTLAGMLQLTNAKWLHGCSGRNLDILARQPLWNVGMDYKCGTGHGVGYILNVHEGPQSIRWRFAEGAAEAVLEEGMDVTNEPGVYVEGQYGIRIENVMVAQNAEKNEYGQFMNFETLTWVPIDMEALEEKYMTREQMVYLSHYQQMVYEKISPYLNEEEKEWLRNETVVPLRADLNN